jgi:hypothetical protein
MSPTHVFCILHGLLFVPLALFFLIVDEVVFKVVVLFDDDVMAAHDAWSSRSHVAELPVTVAILINRQTTASAHPIFQLVRAERAAVDSVLIVMYGL